ncbi:hypothetical protein AB2L28_17700 [Kineococcus sp. TBRC 1896]|uniref:Uncharacterized protein n=1 Tax=Kineococcus mangrovi TaxID=1660183 RepID=A0ABV4I5W0_9ACTN
MIVATIVAVGVVLVALVAVLVVRDRGRDRSARRQPGRDDFDRAASTGVATYRHEQSPNS